MKKALIVISILLLPFLLSGCTKKKDDSGQEQTANGSQEQIFSGTFQELIKLGKNFKCSAVMKTGEGEAKIVTYVSGKKARTDITVDVPGEQKMESHTFVDTEYMYMWSNMMEQGTKMKLSEMEDMANDYETSESAQANLKDMQTEYDYKCVPWVPNTQTFILPSGIEFVDMTEMMKGFEEGMNQGDMNKAGCSACNMLPEGSQRDDCLSQLGCE